MEKLKYAVKNGLEDTLLQIIPRPPEDSNNLVMKFFIDSLLSWLSQTINWNTTEANLRKTELIYKLSEYIYQYIHSQFYLLQYRNKHGEIVSAIIDALADVIWLEDNEVESYLRGYKEMQGKLIPEEKG